MKKLIEIKAITLIALVITIVILIILAAVAINLSLGNNGIFNRAKIGKELYQNAEEYEKTQDEESTNIIDSYINNDRAGTSNERYGYDETTGFYYQIFSNGFCMMWKNYAAPNNTASAHLTFPYEFEVNPGVQITKTTSNSTSNNIVVTNITTTYVNIDTNYGTGNKCSFSISVCGKLKD